MSKQPQEVNFFAWTPRDQRNYGLVCITGTTRACEVLLKAIVTSSESHEFVLGMPTVEDVAQIGSGLKSAFQRLRVTTDSEHRNEIEVRVDPSVGTVEFLVSDGVSKRELVEALEEVSRGCGDTSLQCRHGKRMVSVWYWPCFGHIMCTRPPTNVYPE
jgi:hypothetical protein